MESRAETPSAEELVAHAAFVRWLAFDLVGNVHEAEEVAQETMLRALKRPPAIIKSVKAWLAGVTRNVARMHRRTEGRRARREHAAARPDALPPAADSAATMEVLRGLTDAVDDLGEPYRATVLLRYYEGLMPAEIARRTDVPVKTVKTRLHRALTRLRERLDERHGNRRAWALVLMPFARRGSAGVAPVVSGAILVTLKTKLSVAFAAILLVAGAVALSVGNSETPSLPRESDDSPLVAALADSDSPREGSEETDAPTAFAPAADEGTRETECWVEARVIDARTERPLAGVAVHRHGVEQEAQLDPDDESIGTMWIAHALQDRIRTSTSVTGGDGGARVGATPGPHVLIVRHPRYRDFVGKRFPLREGERKTFEIRLEPYPEGERELAFGGVVTDGETERPLEAVRVVCRYREGAAVKTLEARTGADGRYLLTVPKNALLAISFEKEGYEDRPLAVNPVHQPWYPGDVTLVRANGGPRRGQGRLTGRITDAVTGEPVAAATITLERGLDASGGGGIGGWSGFGSGTDGRYRIDLGPVNDAEEWLLMTVFKPGYAKFTTGLVSIAPDRTTEHHVALLRDKSGAAFAGTILDEATGEPVAAARILTEDLFGEAIATAVADEKGRFSLPRRGSECGVKVSAAGYAPFSLEVEDLPMPLRIVLTRADCSVSGIVRDGATRRPLAGATVTYYRDEDGWCGPGPAAVTDEGGAYTIDLAPGRYVVCARAGGFGVRYGQPVDLANGAKGRADIALFARDCVLSGTVIDGATRRALPQGAESVFTLRLPIGEADRINCDMAPWEEPPDVKTDGGSFSVALTPGRYELSVNLSGYLRYTREVRLAAGEPLAVEIELDPIPDRTVTVRGIVRKPGTKEPAPGRPVFFEYEGTFLGQTASGPDGRFEMKVPPGAVSVQAHPAGPDDSSGEAVRIATKAGEVAEVELFLGD